MSQGNKTTVANNRVYFMLPFNQALSAVNALQYFPPFGDNDVTNSSFTAIDVNIGKKFYIESLKVIVTGNTKDGITNYNVHDLVGIRGTVIVGIGANGEFQITFAPPLTFERSDQIALSIDTVVSTAGSVRTNLFYALCFYLTQEEA